MVSRKAMAILLVVHMATMLASQTEAFVPIFTYSELQKMQVRNPAAQLAMWLREFLPCTAWRGLIFLKHKHSFGKPMFNDPCQGHQREPTEPGPRQPKHQPSQGCQLLEVVTCFPTPTHPSEEAFNQ
jgi:hypothetical protein